MLPGVSGVNRSYFFTLIWYVHVVVHLKSTALGSERLVEAVAAFMCIWGRALWAFFIARCWVRDDTTGIGM